MPYQAYEDSLLNLVGWLLKKLVEFAPINNVAIVLLESLIIAVFTIATFRQCLVTTNTTAATAIATNSYYFYSY